jgi:molybdenum cofactor synthesis domain-containing protein
VPVFLLGTRIARVADIQPPRDNPREAPQNTPVPNHLATASQPNSQPNPQPNPIRVAILTVSDKGSRGERTDQSGPALAQWLTQRSVEIASTAMVADEQPLIANALREWSDSTAIDLIVTTGGTGLSPRDVTPEATAQVLDRTIPGFSEAMRAASLTKTPYAMLSRALCGIRGRTLIVNLPGSPVAAIENLEAIWPAVPHAIRKLQGDTQDCVPPL